MWESAAITERVQRLLADRGLSGDALQDLAGSLLWRIGRASDDGPVTVRVGFATSAHVFAELPRLRNASEEEIEAAVQAGELRVEWVGLRGR